MDAKEEPLNVNNAPRGRKESVKRKRGNSERRKKKYTNNTKIYIIIALTVFAIIFLFLNYYIYRNLKTLSELKTTLETRYKELEEGDKTRIELLEKIDSVEKQIELKKKYIKEKKEIDAQKFEEYNNKKKIYENIEDMLNKIHQESQKTIVLDEAINNLNQRIQNLS